MSVAPVNSFFVINNQINITQEDVLNGSVIKTTDSVTVSEISDNTAITDKKVIVLSMSEPTPAERRFRIKLNMIKYAVSTLGWFEKEEIKSKTIHEAIIDSFALHLSTSTPLFCTPSNSFRKAFYALTQHLLDFKADIGSLDIKELNNGNLIKIFIDEKFLKIPIDQLEKIHHESDIVEMEKEFCVVKEIICGALRILCKTMGSMQIEFDEQAKVTTRAAKKFSGPQKCDPLSETLKPTYENNKNRARELEERRVLAIALAAETAFIEKFKIMQKELHHLSHQPYFDLNEICFQLGSMREKCRQFLEGYRPHRERLIANMETNRANFDPVENKQGVGKYLQNSYESATCSLNNYIGRSLLMVSILEKTVSYLKKQELFLSGADGVNTPAEEFEASSSWMRTSLNKSFRRVKKERPSLKSEVKKPSRQSQPLTLEKSKTVTISEIATGISPNKNTTRASQGNKKKVKKSKRGAKKRVANNSAEILLYSEAQVTDGKNLSTVPMEKPKIYDAFIKASKEYTDFCDHAMQAYAGANFQGMSGDLSRQWSLAIGEVKRHARYAEMALGTLYEVVKRGSPFTLRDIIPNCILDLFIQLEQMLRFVYIFNNHDLNHEHQLIATARQINIFEKLSTETQKYLADMNLGTVWTRYPRMSKKFYESRSKLSLPAGLKVIESTQSPEMGKGSNDRVKNMITTIFRLYSSHIQSSFEILSAARVCDGQALEALKLSKEKMTRELEYFRKETLAILPLSEFQSLIFEPEKEISEFSKAMVLLGDEANKIHQLVLRVHGENIGRFSLLKEHLTDARWHILRLVENIQLFLKHDDSRSKHLFFRSYFKFSLVLECLYTARWILKEKGALLHHKLSNHHVCLQDAKEMDPSAFSFNKSLQYAQQSHYLSTEARYRVEYLEQLERAESRAESLDEDLFAKNFLDFIEKSLPLLVLHVEACRKDFDAALPIESRAF